MKQSSNCSHYCSVNTKNIMKNLPQDKQSYKRFPKRPSFPHRQQVS